MHRENHTRFSLSLSPPRAAQHLPTDPTLFSNGRGRVVSREAGSWFWKRWELVPQVASAVPCPRIMHPLDHGLKYSHLGSGSCVLIRALKMFPQNSSKNHVKTCFSWCYKHSDSCMICFCIETVIEERKVLLCWEKELWSLVALQLLVFIKIKSISDLCLHRYTYWNYCSHGCEILTKQADDALASLFPPRCSQLLILSLRILFLFLT